MISRNAFNHHEEVWLLLPWLANGHLGDSERERAERHVQGCIVCSEQLQLEQRLVEALAAPERITYAPGPSFRKLLERINEAPPADLGERVRSGLPVSAPWVSALWRPPGLAWAATFVFALGLGGLGYRWTAEPALQAAAPYRVHTDAPPVQQHHVLHIAFDRKLPIGEVGELLRADGARVVEWPAQTGIVGVTLAAADPEHDPQVTRKMQALADKLRSDPRVRWVEPVDSP